MGALTTFFVSKKGAILIGPSASFWNIEHAPPNRSTSLNLQLQNKNNCALLDFIFSVYIHGS
jgi:hypothetical protein